MRTRRRITRAVGGTGLAIAIALGGTVAVSAATDPNDAAAPTRIERLCERSDEIAARIDRRQEWVTERTARLVELRARAEANGHDHLVARIDILLGRLEAATARLADREARWAELVAEHCAG